MSEEFLVTPTPGPFFTVLAMYFMIIGAIGYVAAKQTTSLKEFFVMGGRAGVIVSGLAYFATQYSMGTFVGVPAVTYNTGFAGMSISVPGLAFSMIIPALFVGRKLMVMGHRYGFLTMADYLSDRYESSGIRIFHATMMVIFLTAMIGAQTVGAGVILHTFTGLPEWVGVVGMGAIVIVYCMAGGMRGAMLTDVLQGILMIATAIVTFYVSVKAGGGFEAITENIIENDGHAYLTHPGAKNDYGWPIYVSMIIMWSFFTIGQPTLFTKFFTMKNFKTLFKAVILGTAGMLFSATLIEWAGVNALVTIIGLTGKETDFIVPMLLQQSLNPVIASILIAGIMSAGMSTIDALLIIATGGVTRDIYQNVINPQATDKQILKLSQIITVLIGIAGVIIGIIKPATIFDLIRFAFGGLGIWVTPVILGIYWRKSTLIAAIISVIVGEIFYVVMKLGWILPVGGFDPLIISWVASMILMVVISLVTPQVSEATIKRHFDNLKS